MVIGPINVKVASYIVSKYGRYLESNKFSFLLQRFTDVSYGTCIWKQNQQQCDELILNFKLNVI